MLNGWIIVKMFKAFSIWSSRHQESLAGQVLLHFVAFTPIWLSLLHGPVTSLSYMYSNLFEKEQSEPNAFFF